MLYHSVESKDAVSLKTFTWPVGRLQVTCDLFIPFIDKSGTQTEGANGHQILLCHCYSEQEILANMI